METCQTARSIGLDQWLLTGVRRSRFKGSVDVIRYFDILGINTF